MMRSAAFKTVALVILLPFVAVGCAGMSPTLKGGAIGAGVGAATGAAAGAILGEPGKGAAVGGIVGAIGGLLLGEMYSQAQKQEVQTNIPRPPSESYSTTLPSPSPKTSNEPLLIVNSASKSSDKELTRIAMVLMGDILTSNGIKFEEYTVSSAAKYPNASVVSLVDVSYLTQTNSNPQDRYRVALKLSRSDIEPQYFFGDGPNVATALSKALLGK